MIQPEQAHHQRNPEIENVLGSPEWVYSQQKRAEKIDSIKRLKNQKAHGLPRQDEAALDPESYGNQQVSYIAVVEKILRAVLPRVQRRPDDYPRGPGQLQPKWDVRIGAHAHTHWCNYISNLPLLTAVTYHAIMSYRSLLFCPDEKAARAVTQILSELDFTVEEAAEPFAAVKTLADEHFDALVVDCSNEQDASLLFKAAKSSSHNHSSLSVAVVEGQAGVAKAFRIGANLVLTKPINIEQSKGTLRVARGLLRKAQAKPAANSAATPALGLTATPSVASAPNVSAADLPLEAKPSAPLTSIAPVVAPTLVPIMQSAPKPAPPATPASPFSAFEVEEEVAPATEASDAAVLESLHDSTSKSDTPAVIPLGQAEPIAASTSSQAAAAAPALEKKPVELKTAGAAPMFTNEPILAEVKNPEPIEIEAPTFSSLDAAARKSGGGNGFLKIAAILLIAGVVGYPAWQKFQPLQYLHRSSAAASSTDDASAPAQPVAQQEAPAPPSQPAQDAVSTATTPATQNPQETVPTISAGDVDSNAGKHATSAHSSGSETIELQELPLSPDGKPAFTKTTITAKPQSQPLVVKRDAGKLTTKSKSSQISAPSVQIAASNNSEAQLADLISTPVALPKAAPGTLRISQGVSQGLLLKKVAPVYPPEALRMHKEGVVQLLATIAKNGNINNVKVLGGDPTLAQAAADAVLRWKYRPYLLNGQPVEIETQISVVFKAPH